MKEIGKDILVFWTLDTICYKVKKIIKDLEGEKKERRKLPIHSRIIFQSTINVIKYILGIVELEKREKLKEIKYKKKWEISTND